MSSFVVPLFTVAVAYGVLHVQKSDKLRFMIRVRGSVIVIRVRVEVFVRIKVKFSCRLGKYWVDSAR